jgi:hypothetical protein
MKNKTENPLIPYLRALFLFCLFLFQINSNWLLYQSQIDCCINPKWITKVDCWEKGLRVCLEHLRILNFAPHLPIVKKFTREYTQCTARFTFCFVVVRTPLIKLCTISADSWSNMIRHDQTWSDMIRHDQTWSDMIRHNQKLDQTWSDMIRLEISVKFFLWI